MSTHTPGPWMVDPGAIPVIHIPWRPGQLPGFRKGEIARVAGMGNADATQQIANARLIAAAPELLAALEAIGGMRVDASTDHAQLSALCIAVARAAIAKAKGEQS